LSSIIIDHFGLLGADVRRIRLRLVLGVLFALAGAILLQEPQNGGLNDLSSAEVQTIFF